MPNPFALKFVPEYGSGPTFPFSSLFFISFLQLVFKYARKDDSIFFLFFFFSFKKQRKRTMLSEREHDFVMQSLPYYMRDTCSP